jgi:O-succinylbenzoate synthase
MRYIFRIGWADSVKETDWTTLQDVAQAYDIVFDPTEHTTLRKMHDQVDLVNGEGNYHEFIFQVLDVRGA